MHSTQDRRKKLNQLKSLSGKIHLDLELKSLEKAELQRQSLLKHLQHDARS
ncbi:MAG: hypothetical protein KF876_11110 [Nitrospira sp.]|nr:hypothetical protein [Nitrospira sp.]MDR4463608.1 hypothetical protein [Nitrospira sp.]